MDVRLESYAGDTRSRNLYWSEMQVVLYKKLACVLVSLVPSFFWYSFLHAVEHSSVVYSSTEAVRHVTRTVQRDWPESCC